MQSFIPRAGTSRMRLPHMLVLFFRGKNFEFKLLFKGENIEQVNINF